MDLLLLLGSYCHKNCHDSYLRYLHCNSYTSFRLFHLNMAIKSVTWGTLGPCTKHILAAHLKIGLVRDAQTYGIMQGRFAWNEKFLTKYLKQHLNVSKSKLHYMIASLAYQACITLKNFRLRQARLISNLVILFFNIRGNVKTFPKPKVHSIMRLLRWHR